MKTGLKKVKVGVQSDTNLKAMTMGNGWQTRAMRKAGSSDVGGGGKARTKAMIPPIGGWVGAKQ